MTTMAMKKRTLSIIVLITALLLLLPAYAKIEAASKSIYVIKSIDLKGEYSDIKATFSYNKNGMISVIKSVEPGATIVDKLSYDKNGRLIKLYETGGKNQKEKFTYSYKNGKYSKVIYSNKELKQIYSYNWSGNKYVMRVRYVYSKGEGEDSSSTVILDKKGRIVEHVSTDPGESSTMRSSYGYDSKGCVVTIKSENSAHPEYNSTTKIVNKYIGDRLVETSQKSDSRKIKYTKIKVPEKMVRGIMVQQDYIKHNLWLGWASFITPVLYGS